MPEDFLHFIWLYQLFDHSNILSSSGERIQILSPGIHNHNSGPDFSEARIKIDETLWIGNIEIHVLSSDWFLHQHQYDPAYSNVILHVVFEDDLKGKENKLSHLPTIQLKGKIDQSKFLQWQRLNKRTSWLPCEKFIGKVPSIVISQMVTRSAIDRLERKVEDVEIVLQRLNGHWDNALMQTVITSIGSKVNKEAFRSLAALLPYEYIRKNEDFPLKLEALVFGIAGFLEGELKDNYPNELKDEFNFLRRKHEYKTMNTVSWKFMRMRPPNFPTIRIAQLTGIFSNWSLFSKQLFYEQDISTIKYCFENEINSYWYTHFRFDKLARSRSKRMGKTMVNNILINGVVPFLYAYGKLHDEQRFIQGALSLLEELKPESNSIMTQWKNRGVEAKSALESQGLLELKNNFCSSKKCLSCKIGVWILNPN